ANLQQFGLRRRIMTRIDPSRGVEVLTVRSIVVEEEILGDSIGERLLGDFVPRVILTRALFHRLELGQRGVASGCVFCTVSRDELFEKIWPLEDDAAASVLRRRLAEITQEVRLLKYLPQRPLVMNRFFSELNNRARLDITPRADVVREASGCWA